MGLLKKKDKKADIKLDENVEENDVLTLIDRLNEYTDAYNNFYFLIKTGTKINNLYSSFLNYIRK